MTNNVAQNTQLTEQLQHYRHEVASARADLKGQQRTPPELSIDMLQALDSIGKSELKAASTSQTLRTALLARRPETWALEDLDQVLARIDEALVELVKPG